MNTNAFEGFSETERGNTYLVGGEGKTLILIGLNVDETDNEPSQFLSISIIPDNYPAVNVDEIKIYLKDLANDIKEYNDGWFICKWNLPFEPQVDKSGFIENDLEDEEEVA